MVHICTRVFLVKIQEWKFWITGYAYVAVYIIKIVFQNGFNNSHTHSQCSIYSPRWGIIRTFTYICIYMLFNFYDNGSVLEKITFSLHRQEIWEWTKWIHRFLYHSYCFILISFYFRAIDVVVFLQLPSDLHFWFFVLVISFAHKKYLQFSTAKTPLQCQV